MNIPYEEDMLLADFMGGGYGHFAHNGWGEGDGIAYGNGEGGDVHDGDGYGNPLLTDYRLVKS